MFANFFHLLLRNFRDENLQPKTTHFLGRKTLAFKRQARMLFAKGKECDFRLVDEIGDFWRVFFLGILA